MRSGDAWGHEVNDVRALYAPVTYAYLPLRISSSSFFRFLS